jgi:ribonuclease HI
MIEIYTDGAYSSLRNQGGIAFVIVKDGKEVFNYSKTFKNTTNNRCEILAAIIALESIKIPSSIKIISDSQYLVNTMNLGWNKIRKNSDLWIRMDKTVAFHKLVEFEWVRGHSTNEYNNKCDKLANRCSVL